MRIDEALEIKIKLNRIDIGDPETIRDKGIGATSSPDMMIACGLRIADDVPRDEKVRCETQLTNDFQFTLHSCNSFRASLIACGERSRTIATATTFTRKFDEQLIIVAF